MKEKTTKVKGRKVRADEMRSEYDFSKAVRGKYYKRLVSGTNVIVLDPDVAKNFNSSQAVNEALRNLLRVAEAATRLTRSSGRGKKRRAA